MNILKEQIKLSVAYPGWRLAIKKLKSNKNKKIFLFGTPMHGNLGDHAIAIQEQYFFEDFFPDYEYFEILMPMYHIQKKIIKNSIQKGREKNHSTNSSSMLLMRSSLLSASGSSCTR